MLFNRLWHQQRVLWTAEHWSQSCKWLQESCDSAIAHNSVGHCAFDFSRHTQWFLSQGTEQDCNGMSAPGTWYLCERRRWLPWESSCRLLHSGGQLRTRAMLIRIRPKMILHYPSMMMMMMVWCVLMCWILLFKYLLVVHVVHDATLFTFWFTFCCFGDYHRCQFSYRKFPAWQRWKLQCGGPALRTSVLCFCL